VVCVILWYGTQNKPSYNRAPKKIWTYLQEQNNGLVMPSKEEIMCITSWKKWNPEYEIVILTKKTLKGYITIPERIKNHPIFTDRFIDLVRLWALEEHGGVWLDPNVVVKAPLDKWMFPKYAEFSGFYEMSKYENKEIINTWFMAANKKCKMIKAWTTAFSKLADYPHLDYYLKSRSITHTRDPVQIAFQEVFYQFPRDTFILKKAHEGIIYPLSH
jgi:hypothetical protein